MSPVRRVRRVIRKIDPWTVLKVSLVFNALMALAFMLGSVIFWCLFFIYHYCRWFQDRRK